MKENKCPPNLEDKEAGVKIYLIHRVKRILCKQFCHLCSDKFQCEIYFFKSINLFNKCLKLCIIPHKVSYHSQINKQGQELIDSNRNKKTFHKISLNWAESVNGGVIGFLAEFEVQQSKDENTGRDDTIVYSILKQ